MAEVLICSGGTGGHMFPACALFEILKSKGRSVKLITDDRGNVFCNAIENSDKILLETVRFSIRGAIPLAFRLFFIFLKLLRCWWRDPPKVAVGFGNFCTIVPLITARIFGAKIILYEQNAIVGKANRFLEKIAAQKFSNFPIEGWKTVPSPVRKEFAKEKHKKYICDGKIKILIIGGSQGAKSFNEIIPHAVSELSEEQRENIELIQQVSYEEVQPLSDFYHKLGVKASLVKFIYNVAEIMADSQLVICRSGASTLTELSTIGRPAVLIPYPRAANNHQLKNAEIFEKNGAAWIIEEKQNNADTAKELSQLLKKFLGNRELLKSAASNMMKSSTVESEKSFVSLIDCFLNKNN